MGNGRGWIGELAYRKAHLVTVKEQICVSLIVFLSQSSVPLSQEVDLFLIHPWRTWGCADSIGRKMGPSDSAAEDENTSDWGPTQTFITTDHPVRGLCQAALTLKPSVTATGAVHLPPCPSWWIPRGRHPAVSQFPGSCLVLDLGWLLILVHYINSMCHLCKKGWTDMRVGPISWRALFTSCVEELKDSWLEFEMMCVKIFPINVDKNIKYKLLL